MGVGLSREIFFVRAGPGVPGYRGVGLSGVGLSGCHFALFVCWPTKSSWKCRVIEGVGLKRFDCNIVCICNLVNSI